MHKKISTYYGLVIILLLQFASSAFAQNLQFSANLKRGSSSSEVTRLQEFLKAMPDIYPEGITTGYFGTLTEKAVRRFQAKYGIEQVGIVGQKTRAKLNILIMSGNAHMQTPPQSLQHVSPQPKKELLPQQSGIQKQQTTVASPVSRFMALEKELLEAKTSKIWLSPTHYERIISDLLAIESKGYSRSEIQRVRDIARGLAPHIIDQKNAQKSAGTLSSPMTTAPAPQTMTAQIPKALILKNLGVSFEPWNKNTNRAGAFLFLQSENKLFLEYGAEVQSPDGIKILPTFEYRTARDADVFATIDGIVTKVAYQENTQDYEIHIQPEPNSQWTFGHDHVSSIKISKGDLVKAGDIIGKVGVLGGQLGRTEIMFWTSIGGRPLTYCPFKYFDPQLLSEYEQKVARHMKDWEEFKGNTGLYNQEKHIFPGCAYETLED